MKREKLFSLVLASILAGLCITGCQSGEGSAPAENGSSTGESGASEPVELVWWMPGPGEQRDTQQVNEYLNEQLKSYEGLEHVSVILYPQLESDYTRQVTLGISADLPMDILSANYSCPFQDFVADGTLVSIQQYMDLIPEVTETLPEWLMEYGQLDGEQYIIPNFQQIQNVGFLWIPYDYIEKGYTTEEDFEKMASVETPLEERAQMMEELLIRVREGENADDIYAYKLLLTYGDYDFGWFDEIATNFVLREGSTEVVYFPFEEDKKQAYGIMADWYSKGYFPPDMMLQTEEITSTESGYPPFAITEGHDILPIELVESQSIPNNTKVNGEPYTDKVKAHYLTDYAYSKYTWVAGGNGITSSCEHPEEAVKFIQCMNVERGKELYNTVVYGLEGVHWEWVDKENDMIRTLDYDVTQADSSAPYGQWKWVCGNTFNAYLNQACSAETNEAALKQAETVVTSPITGMVFDLTGVQSKIDQITAIYGEYEDALKYGTMGADWENYYNEFVEKVKLAGVDEVLAEMQKQVDEFLAQ